MLKFRIDYLKNVVDYFVIVEASTTHTKNKKEQNFSYDFFDEETQKKIIYFFIDFPEDEILSHLDYNAFYMKQTDEGLATWARENYQRNYISNGLKSASDDDLVLISDVDEIIDTNAIQYLKNNKNILEQYNIVSLRQTPFYYNIFNPFRQTLQQEVQAWYHPKATLKKYIDKPNLVRMSMIGVVLDHSGWHFGYFGGSDRVKTKHQSTSLHSEEPDSLLDRAENTAKIRQEVLALVKSNDINAIAARFKLPRLIFSDKYYDFFTAT
jgi:beta-1,4-mannosyl-glycoprotein beta-1,4-N-acetylglucosaminyltransferase